MRHGDGSLAGRGYGEMEKSGSIYGDRGGKGVDGNGELV